MEKLISASDLNDSPAPVRSDIPCETKPALSKNALKRLKKKEEREKTRPEWRAKLKIKRKEARRRKVASCLESGII